MLDLCYNWLQLKYIYNNLLMNKFILNFIFLSLFLSLSQVMAAAVCPHPNNSSLKWGEIPEPWEKNPYSENSPQSDPNNRFVRANILVAGLGRGILCTYANSQGYYSIWWQVNVKVPAFTDNNWRKTLGGYECAYDINDCLFYPA